MQKICLWGLAGFLTMFLSGCQLPDLPSEPTFPEPFHAGEWSSVRRTQGPVSICRISRQHRAKPVFEASRKGIDAVYGWLGAPVQQANLRIFLFSPQEPEGSVLLPEGCSAAGWLHPEKNVLVLVGNPEDRAFWMILRRESARYALRGCLPRTLPFWLSEGVARLFEPGVDRMGHPVVNDRMLKAAQRLGDRRRGLQLCHILADAEPTFKNEDASARAWSVLYHLYMMAPRDSAGVFRTDSSLLFYLSSVYGTSGDRATIRALEDRVFRTVNNAR